MSFIRLRLMGRFSAHDADGRAVAVASLKGRLLLACLAIRPETECTRKRLSAFLWEDRPQEQAQVSLRQEFARLRMALNLPEAAQWSRDGVPTLPDRITVDVLDLLVALEINDPLKIAELYSGEFLEGAEPREPKLMAWVVDTRHDLRRRVLSILQAALWSRPDFEPNEVEQIAAMVTRLDPSCETAHIKLIEAFAAQQKSARAIDQFKILAAVLKEAGRNLSSRAEAALAQVLNNSPDPASASDQAPSDLDWVNEINSQHHVAAPPAPRPHSPPSDRPSLGVLPFRDVTPQARAFAGFEDGLTEEVTTAFARWPDLFVTASHSAMVYKSEPKDIRQVAVELGVNYLVEGSIELRGGSLRVNARLVDGASGTTIWAEALGADAANFLSVRDRIVTEIVGRLVPSMVKQEVERAFGLPTSDLNAWTHLQRARGHLLFGRSPDRLSAAVTELRSALRYDRKFAVAKAVLAWAYAMRALWGQDESAAAEKQKAMRLSRSALRLEPDNPTVLVNCADTALYAAGDIDGSLSLLQRAIAQNAADAHGLALFANVNRCAGGNTDRSIEYLSRAMRLSPRDPRTHRWYHYSAWAYWKQDNFRDMEQAARQAVSLYSDAPAQWIALTCSLGLQGKRDEATRTGAIVKRLLPSFSARSFYAVARGFYGKRFAAEEEHYRQLCSILEDALP
jgi:TolB-like protein/DNA-binding SARP family transcriptional activator/Tfp pilus assembly protein PilF